MARRLLLLCLIWPLTTITVFAQTRGGPDVRYPLEFIVSPPVRDLPPSHRGAHGLREVPFRRPSTKHPSGPLVDPVGQTSTPIASAQSLGQWEGMGAGYPGFAVTAVPPDPNMAVGPNHIVQWVNNSFVVFDKK